MPPTFASPETLYDAIKPSHQNGCVIGIDGHSTSGKSCLGKALAKASGAALISTDKYARQRRPGDSYQDLIDLAHLRGDVDGASPSQLVLIEGICLRDVADAANLRLNLFVYVKRITAAGLWADAPENYLIDGEPNAGLSWVDRQSALYHIKRSPLEHADFLYEHRET